MASKPAARRATSTAATHFEVKPVASKRAARAAGAVSNGATCGANAPADRTPVTRVSHGVARSHASTNGLTSASAQGIASAPATKQMPCAVKRTQENDGLPGRNARSVAPARRAGIAEKVVADRPAASAHGEASKVTVCDATEDAAPTIQAYADALIEGKGPAVNQAAEVVGRLALERPEALVPAIERLTRAVSSKARRSAQAASDALPALARIAPARVAKHLDALKLAYAEATPIGRDGLVRTFSALCAASVAYQKRLEPTLTEALRTCDGKSLVRWSQTVLPSLKGEPHARARLVVEARLYEIPRPHGIKLGEVLGIRLRPAGR